MSNTIELLEAIGKDASMRHATPEELAANLAGMQASEALLRTAATGDIDHLVPDLGKRIVMSTQHSNVTGPGGEETVSVPVKEESDEEEEDSESPATPAPDRH